MYFLKRRNTVKSILNIIFTLTYILLYFFTIYVFYDSNHEFDYGIRGYIVLLILYGVLLTNILIMFGAYEIGNKRIRDICISTCISLFFTNFTMYFIFGLIEGHLVVIYPHVGLLITQSIISIFFSLVGNIIVRNNFPPQKTILIYRNDNVDVLINKLKRYQKYEFEVVNTINENSIKQKDIDNLLCNFECVITYDIDHKIKKYILKKCYEKCISIYDVPGITDVLIKSSSISNLIDTPLFEIKTNGIYEFNSFSKRLIDLCGAILLLLLTSPIMLVSAIVIKTQDSGDVFFKQKRLTKDGKEFELIKFRSMIMNAEPNGKAIRAKINDDRITPFGKFIRSTRIDELPQVFNILKGDLSFVGPRALRVEEYEQNEKDFPEFKYRLKVKAGLTGYAQVYGKYNTSFRDKLLLDLYYIENYSLILDIKLIFMTVLTVLSKDSTEGF